MTSKIFVITAPDDVDYDALRIVSADLTPEQSQMLSNVLKNISLDRDINLYVHSNSDDYQWVIDKSGKADLIFGNTVSDDQQIVGFLASKRQSHFFGDSKLTKSLNKKSIFSEEQIAQIIRNELH